MKSATATTSAHEVARSRHGKQLNFPCTKTPSDWRCSALDGEDRHSGAPGGRLVGSAAPTDSFQHRNWRCYTARLLACLLAHSIESIPSNTAWFNIWTRRESCTRRDVQRVPWIIGAVSCVDSGHIIHTEAAIADLGSTHHAIPTIKASSVRFNTSGHTSIDSHIWS